MSLETRLNELITAIGADIKLIVTDVGPLGSLLTTDTTSIVNALNELKTLIDSVAVGAGAIDDTIISTTTTWSSDKTSTAVNDAINALIDGAPDALNTLIELATELQGQDTALQGLLTAVGNRLRFDEPQYLDPTQMEQGNTNLGSASLVQIGNYDADLVAAYNIAKA